MTSPFHARRRQPFVNEQYVVRQIARRGDLISRLHAELIEPDTDSEGRSQLLASAAEATYGRLSLRYTAGEDPPQLRAELQSVIEALERYQMALAEFEGIPDAAPLGLGRLDDYERCMQLIGLCYLLHRRDLLPRIAALEDPAYAGEDVLYEELLDYAVAGRYDVDTLKFVEVYDPLIEAMYSETTAQAVAPLAKYVDNWYPWFKLVPWHDGHLRINGTQGDYFGYWAFEAGAVALLCNIDDSSIDHMVYPKDLVAWARANMALSEADADGVLRLRCLAGQPCPRAGMWFTPARPGSRRPFAHGETMPEVGGSFGATIWQWESDR